MTEQPVTVLVVDDNPDVREPLAMLLRERGYRVVQAANGREALEQLRRHPATRLILLDMAMPVMDGWEFCDERGRDPELAKIPVVILAPGGQARRDAERLHAYRTLGKPTSVGELLAAVGEIC
jgi:CheY-like chemotaxis protein